VRKMNVGIYYRWLCIRIVFTGSRVPKPWENSLFDQSLYYNSTTHTVLVLLSSFSEKCLRWRFSAPAVTAQEKNPEGNRNATTLDTHCLEGSQGRSILIEFACHHVICSAESHQFGSPGQIDWHPGYCSLWGTSPTTVRCSHEKTLGIRWQVGCSMCYWLASESDAMGDRSRA